MKKTNTLILLLLFTPALTWSQDLTETIERTARFSRPGDAGNMLSIHNINGSVTVTGYSGREIHVIAHKQIWGDTGRARELEFVVEERGNRIYIYLDAPFINVKWYDDRLGYNMNRHDKDYKFVYDIEVKVPEHLRLYASTINRGSVSVQNMDGEVSASNVNGEIVLDNVATAVKVSTVNGKITARFTQKPDKEASFHTVNGTIEVFYPSGLGADVFFQSLHGELYTDFTEIEYLPARVETNRSTRKAGTAYRVGRSAPVRIGQGGPELRFKVLNGDVYIKKITSNS